MVRSLFSSRLNAAWHLFPWPSLVNIEQRRRIDKRFDYTSAYAAGDEVYDEVSNLCWRCVRPVVPVVVQPKDDPANWAQLGDLPAQRTNDPNAQFKVGDRVIGAANGHTYYCISDGAFYADINNPQAFAPLPPWDPAFPLADDFQEPMEEVFNVNSSREDADWRWRLPFALVDDAVRVEGDPGSAWFRYRLRCPELTGDPWDAEATYFIDEQVYYTDTIGVGNFWVCVNGAPPGEAPGSSPLLWRKIELPYIFYNYLSWATHADWLETDGQSDKAAASHMKAVEYLQLEFDKIERQQRQSEPWSVTTR
jgi:hypothetical protein